MSAVPSEFLTGAFKEQVANTAATLTGGTMRYLSTSGAPPSVTYHSLYEELSVTASKSDAVSWTALGVILGLAVVVIGGAFVWLRSDVSDVRGEIAGLRSDAKTDFAGVRDSITDLSRHAASIDSNVAVTNTKLDATNAKLDELVAAVKARK